MNKPNNKNKTNHFSRIDLGECEKVLREKYNLNESVSLLILKFEKLTNVSSERDLQYEVYESINKKKLDLSNCKEIPINIYVPVVLSEKLQGLYNELQDFGYDLFDINNEFYQDNCTPYKSEIGTDVLLSDRIDFYFNNEETQCQPTCQFSDYSVETEDLKCECDIISDEINDEKPTKEIGSKSIYKSFYDVLKFSNYKVLKCYISAFSKTIFKNNKGNTISLAFFLIYLVFLIMYFIKGKTEIKIDLFKAITSNKPKDTNNAQINKEDNLYIINIDNKLKIKKNIPSSKHINFLDVKQQNIFIPKHINQRIMIRKEIKKIKKNLYYFLI